MIKEKTLDKITASPADSSANIFTGRRADLERQFRLNRDSAEFNAEDQWTSLLIGHLFSKENKDAVLRYNDNDTVANVIVLRQRGVEWDTVFSAKLCPVTTGSWNDLVDVSDFNGDDIPDLKVIKNSWNIHPGENSELWLYNENRFTKVQGFDSIVSATYDKRTNQIYSYQSMGCADMTMHFGVFRVTGNKVQPVKEMSCDCCVGPGDSCTIKISGQQPYVVPYKTAYQHVPGFYAEMVREKCNMQGR